MKKLLVLLAMPLMMIACVAGLEDELNQADISLSHYEDLTAGFDEDTRTYIEQGKFLHWHEGDLLSVFYGNTLNSQYKFNGETGDNSGTFSVVPSSNLGTGNPTENIYAVYPYDSTAKISDYGELLLNMPAEQNYAVNSFGKNTNTMVAVTDGVADKFLTFRNVGGYIKLALYGKSTIQSITLQGNGGEKIAGKAAVRAAFNEYPTIAMSEEASDIITLNCGTGVTLGSTIDTATEFWFVVPPTIFEKGFTIAITDINGFVCTKSADKKITIERNAIQPMEALEIVIEAPENNEIWYTSTDGNIVEPYAGTESNPIDIAANFGANILSNTYENGRGIIKFDGDVTHLGAQAFYRCSTISTLILPNGITEIGNAALRGCHKLTSVNVPNKVKTIASLAFAELYQLQEILIPDSVTSIGIGAFIYSNINNFYGKFSTEDHKCLIVDDTLICLAHQVTGEYTLPEGIRVLGKGSLTSFKKDIAITIPNSVEEIESMAVTTSLYITAFRGKYATPDNLSLVKDGVLHGVAARNLKNYQVPDGVTTLDSYLFQNCRTLISIKIPASVTRLLTNTFNGCDGLIAVYLDSTTPPTASNIFYDVNNGISSMNGLPYIYVPASAVDTYKSSSYWEKYADNIRAYSNDLFSITYTSTDGNIVEPYNADAFGANIISNTYENGKGVIKFDGVVAEIGNAAFYEKEGHHRLCTIEIPGSIQFIGDSAFSGCQRLESVTLNEGLVSIGNSAFNNCGHLSSITIPESVKGISSAAFRYTDNLEYFYGKFATKDNKCLIVNGKLIRLAQVSGDYTLPEGITTLGNGSMTTFKNKVSITLPQSLNSIESLAMTSLKNVTGFYGKYTTEDHTMVIKDGILHGVAWASASSERLDIPDGVTTIDQLLCQGGVTIRTIVLPESIKAIRSGALRTTSLKSLFCKATTPPVLSSVIFSDDYCPAIYVPASALDTYKTDQYWSKYAEHITTQNEENCTILYTSTDGNIVTPNSSNAFKANIVSNTYENGVGKIVFDDIVLEFGDEAFKSCATLKSLIIPNGVWKIGMYAFQYCSSMEEVTIPEGVVAIGKEAFHQCHALKSLTLPSSVSSISEKAFFNCNNLDCIYSSFSTDDNRSVIVNKKLIWVSKHISGDYKIPDGVTHLGSYCIHYPDNVITITIPESVTKFSSGPFIGMKNIAAFYGAHTTADNRAVIADGVLYGLATNGITEYSIPEGVKVISYRILRKCGLSSITLPSTLESISGNVFEGCSDMKQLYCKAAVPPTLESNSLSGLTNLSTLYIPIGCFEAYKSAEGWKEFADKMVSFDFGIGDFESENGTFN